jgi:hypothetical protein
MLFSLVSISTVLSGTNPITVGFIFMIVLEIVANEFLLPGCNDCGSITRVIGAETHTVIRQLTVLTFECVQCGALSATLAMPSPGNRGGKDAL